MRACQVCGCASWGPIGNPTELERLREFLPARAMSDLRESFVRCDNCKCVARADLLQDVPTPNASVLPDAEFSGMGSFMKPVMAALMPPMPAPPTRTERLIHTLLRSNTFARTDVGAVVELARFLEWKLDTPPTPVADKDSKKDWLVLSFPAREEFERWVTGFLDAVVNPDAVAGVDYTEHVYERAVVYATKQF